MGSWGEKEGVTGIMSNSVGTGDHKMTPQPSSGRTGHAPNKVSFPIKDQMSPWMLMDPGKAKINPHGMY